MGRFKDEGNIVVSNQSRNVLVNYNFMLRVEGIYDLPCKSVHSFTKENEFEYVQEGGLNDYVHMLRKPVSKPFSFTVERYVGMDVIPPLQLGAELVLPVILMVAPNANQFDNAKRTFVFTGCTVMSKTYGELNAEKSDLLTETIVIGYREMMEVTIPVHEGSAGKLWKFDGKNVEGNGERSANTKGTQTGSPKVRRWLIKEGQEGKSENSARTTQSKPVKVRRWLIKEGQEGKSENSARTTQSKPVKVRRWLIKKNEEGASQKSARKYSDFLDKETVDKMTNSGKSFKRKWKPDVSAKPAVDTGEAKKRKWKPDVSAKPGVDTGEAKKRKWKPDVSAKPAVNTGEAEKRK